MKYDFSKYNNLNFRLKDGTLGFIKVAPNGYIYLYCDRETCKKEWGVDAMMPKNSIMNIFSRESSLEAFIKERAVEIIPRNPETYDNWKVGDKITGKTGKKVYTIIAVLGGAAAVSLDSDVSIVNLTTTEALTKNNKLVLTDYEQEILKAQDEKKAKECPFRKGDRVLVRDEDEDAWIFEIFDSYEGGNEYPYDFKEDCYKQCIPYNEKTWKLLGTTDEYKEE